MNSNGEWVQTPSNTWHQYKKYKQMKARLETMNVVNDPAERVVKDIQDFIKTTNDQEHRDHAIRVGQKQKKSFGKCKKYI